MVSVSDEVICFGDDIVLDTSSETGGTITWSDDIVNGEPFAPWTTGIMTFTATSDSDEDCSFSVEIEVLETPLITVVGITEEILGSDGSIDIEVSGGSPDYVFDWDNDETGDFDDDEDATGLTGGTYTVVVKDESGCESSQGTIVSSQVGIDKEAHLTVEIDPNPTSDVLIIALNGQFSYSLVNIAGEQILTGSAFNQSTLDVSDLANGIYFITLKSNGLNKAIRIEKI